MKKAIAILFFITVHISIAAPAPQIQYTLTIDQPHTNYVSVEMRLQGIKKNYIDVIMPVWAPGSYLVRDFAKSVEAFEAFSGSETLRSEKIDKSTWRVYTQKQNNVRITYKVYAFEISVRTSFVDASHAFISPSGVFMYVDGYKETPVTLTVSPYKQWNKISTGLRQVEDNKWVYSAENYDILADSPLEIGTHKILEFTVSGVKHKVAMYGQVEFDEDQVTKDMAKLVKACINVFGEIPVKDYTFIIHNLTKGGGGLEHSNSTTLQIGRWAYSSASDYLNFLGIVAHEYFHLWNVKRVRPIALGPFDYKNENYTTLLWFSEGFTSYYDELLLNRTGLINNSEYLKRLSKTITTIENQPGSKVQPLAEASFDAWIKAYKPNENSSNTTISYYSKGSVIASLLDLAVINHTNGEKNLDDVMKYLYREFYKKKDTGFTEKDLRQAFISVAGFNAEEIFDKYINSTDEIDYKKYFGYAGIEVISSQANENAAQFGAAISDKEGKLMVNNITRSSAAHEGGINVNDEIIAVDGYRVHSSLFAKILETKAPGDSIKITLSRDGLLQDVNIKLKRNSHITYSLIRSGNRSEQQDSVYRKWLGASNK